MARALRARSEKARDLKALLDDCPFLDERHSVFDPVDYHLDAGGNRRSAERASSRQLTSAEMFVGDLTFAGWRDLSGDYSQCALDLGILG